MSWSCLTSSTTPASWMGRAWGGATAPACWSTATTTCDTWSSCCGARSRRVSAAAGAESAQRRLPAGGAGCSSCCARRRPGGLSSLSPPRRAALLGDRVCRQPTVAAGPPNAAPQPVACLHVPLPRWPPLCHAGARAVVITDSLFSMDGDFADLPGLAALRRKYGFLLVSRRGGRAPHAGTNATRTDTEHRLSMLQPRPVCLSGNARQSVPDPPPSAPCRCPCHACLAAICRLWTRRTRRWCAGSAAAARPRCLGWPPTSTFTLARSGGALGGEWLAGPGPRQHLWAHA